MNKKLKIQFWKAEKALVMQILEQERLPYYKDDGFVNINTCPWISKTCVDLRGEERDRDLEVSRIAFDTNIERDNYLQEVVNAITDELFTGYRELEFGEMCEVSRRKSDGWVKRKLLAVLPKKYKNKYKFITESVDEGTLVELWTFARPIVKRIEPTLNKCGNVFTYTWEEK